MIRSKDYLYIEAHAGKVPDREIAEHIGCSEQTIANWRKRLNVDAYMSRLTDKEIEFINEHYQKDMTGREIAEKLGRSTSSVSTICKKLGIKGRSMSLRCKNCKFMDNCKCNSPLSRRSYGRVISREKRACRFFCKKATQ